MAKKGIFSKLSMNIQRSDDYAKSTLPTNRWELFWDTLKGNFGKILLTNIIMLVLFAPLIFLILLNFAGYSTMGQSNQFNAGTGPLGYPAPPNMMGLQEMVVLQTDITYLKFLPLVMLFAGLALSGGAYIIRNLVWGEGVFVANDFLKGIKKNYIVVTASLLIYSVLFLFIMILKDYAVLLSVTMPKLRWLFIVSQVLLYVFLALITIMVIYMVLMGVTYKLKFGALIKNAFIFAISLLPSNLIMLAVSALPYVFLFFGTFLMSIGFLIIILLGIAFTVLVWTVYGHWVFDKYININLPKENRNRGVYDKQKRVNEKEVDKYKAQKKVVSDLTSRPIKPIDDDIVIEELPTNFSRADLQRLSDQKENMRKDHDKYVSEHINDERYVAIRQQVEEDSPDDETERLLEMTRLELEGKKANKPKKKKSNKKGKR
ncbi:MAG: hypothetical protein J6B16_04960 [Clostridia bacterium]|nr:hypothetical protein [Clostridia bacterium]